MIIDHNHHEHFEIHKLPLMMAGGVIAITIAMTAAVTMGWADRAAVPSEVRASAGIEAVSARTLRFFDETDGTVRIEDGASGTELARHGPGTGGFVRSTVRSLVHGRRIRGIGAETPFTLTLWENDALTLLDPTTGRSVELASFGADNREIFAALLKRDQS